MNSKEAIFTAILLISFLCMVQQSYCCTVIMASRDGKVLVGNNEDRNHFETVISVIPPDGDQHGVIMFGYDDAPFQGGMNDQGLFIDGNAVSPTGWKAEEGKPAWRENSLRKLLGLRTTERDAEYFMKSVLLKCATVKEVKEFVSRYNLPGLAQSKFPVADRTGASIVVEFADGKVRCSERSGWYQISTNIITSGTTAENYSCWRYKAADRLLSDAKELTVPLIRDILKATHQKEAEHGVTTVYSNIYDLRSGVIMLYRRGDFDRTVTLVLNEELKKGNRMIRLSSLFD